MKRELYNRIYDRLRHPEDVEIIAKEEGLDHEVVFVIYSQRTVRRATKRYYKIKHSARRLIDRWRRGETFLELAEREDFPPMLMAFILVQEMGHSKKSFWKFVRGEARAPTKRLEKELQEARCADLLYSPEANDQQDERGKNGEDRLAVWLDSKGIGYMTEDDLREANHTKTPDFLLEEPVTINGFTYHWFESKAIFADDTEYRRHVKNQLQPYHDIYGTGAVAYWLGYLEDLEEPEGIKLHGPDFFKTSE